MKNCLLGYDIKAHCHRSETSAPLSFCEENLRRTEGFLSQKDSNTESVSISCCLNNAPDDRIIITASCACDVIAYPGIDTSLLCRLSTLMNVRDWANGLLACVHKATAASLQCWPITCWCFVNQLRCVFVFNIIEMGEEIENVPMRI